MRALRPTRLRLLSGNEPQTLDPQFMVGQPEGRITVAIFDGLAEDEERTVLMLRDAEVRMMSQQPLIPLYIEPTNFMRKPYVKNLEANLLDQHDWRQVYRSFRDGSIPGALFLPAAFGAPFL